MSYVSDEEQAAIEAFGERVLCEAEGQCRFEPEDDADFRLFEVVGFIMEAVSAAASLRSEVSVEAFLRGVADAAASTVAEFPPDVASQLKAHFEEQFEASLARHPGSERPSAVH
jgi:hypothetical protein